MTSTSATSQSLAPQSRDASPSHITDSTPPHHDPFANGHGENHNPASIPPPSNGTVAQTLLKKPTLSTRLTRMFSHRGDVPPPMRESRDSYRDTREGSVTGHAPETTTRPDMPASRQTSTSRSSNGVPERTPSQAATRRPEPSPQIRRFGILEDGTHEHHLKTERRQEKLSDMFNRILGKKKSDDDDTPEIHQLSLMSSWVDQVKNEKVAGDVKGGPNYESTLVEKYGKCQEVVGRGAFGIVRISHKPDVKGKEQLYAVKEFRRRPQESPKKYNKRLTSEFCISSALRHPNVIHTLDLMKDAKGDFCEVMEYCAGGDLYTLVLAAGKLEVIEADCYFKQLMRGVEYIHEMGVAHRDLKPENLLLTTHGALKITDFGNGECFRMAWEKEAHMVAGLCGSAPYIAPEEYVDNEFDPRAVDVWACGVIYMAMRTGRHLWRVARKDEDEFYERYLEGRKDEDGYAPIETLHRVSFCLSSSPFACFASTILTPQ